MLLSVCFYHRANSRQSGVLSLPQNSDMTSPNSFHEVNKKKVLQLLRSKGRESLRLSFDVFIRGIYHPTQFSSQVACWVDMGRLYPQLLVPLVPPFMVTCKEWRGLKLRTSTRLKSGKSLPAHVKHVPWETYKFGVISGCYCSVTIMPCYTWMKKITTEVAG